MKAERRTKLTRRQRRAVDRRVGRRELTRRAQSMLEKIHELDGRGYPPVTIARVTGLSEAVVVLALEADQGGEG